MFLSLSFYWDQQKYHKNVPKCFFFLDLEERGMIKWHNCYRLLNIVALIPCNYHFQKFWSKSVTWHWKYSKNRKNNVNVKKRVSVNKNLWRDHIHLKAVSWCGSSFGKKTSFTECWISFTQIWAWSIPFFRFQNVL